MSGDPWASGLGPRESRRGALLTHQRMRKGPDMTTARARLLLAAERAVAKSQDPTRHKCFLSYHRDDIDEVEAFIDSFGEVFIPRVLGVTDEDDFVDSTDTDYVMDCIREKYLTDSTVTIVLIGKCTWARRYRSEEHT